MTQLPDPNQPVMAPAKSDMSWAAMVSLICGIVSILSVCTGFIPVVGWFCCSPIGFLTFLAGIVFGIVGIKSEKALMAKIGIGLCGLYFLLMILGVILMFVFGFALPAMSR